MPQKIAIPLKMYIVAINRQLKPDNFALLARNRSFKQGNQ